jgi:hypothetical protein
MTENTMNTVDHKNTRREKRGSPTFFMVVGVYTGQPD